jgi:hypothetical protein
MRFLVIVVPSGGYANATLFEQQGCARAESAASVSPIDANLKCHHASPALAVFAARSRLFTFWWEPWRGPNAITILRASAPAAARAETKERLA